MPIYAEIAFRNSFPDETPEHIRLRIGKHNPAAYLQHEFFPKEAEMFSTFLKNWKPKLDVLIPAELAHPKGSFFPALLQQRERMQGLIISFQGTRNPRLCTSCIGSYESTVTATGEHVLSPCHECVSHPSISEGACSNCVWSARAPTCEWREFSGYRLLKKDKDVLLAPFAEKEWNATIIEDGDGKAEYINQKNAPRLLADVPPPFKRKVL